MLLEIHKERAKESQALAELARLPTASPSFDENLEPRVECLQQCLQSLSGEDHQLILQYYQGEKNDKIENRQGLAARFKVSLNTLRMRALRLREKLQVARSLPRRGGLRPDRWLCGEGERRRQRPGVLHLPLR